MIEDKELGLKIAESPREAMIHKALEATEKRIEELELGLELDKVILEYLKKQKQ